MATGGVIKLKRPSKAEKELEVARTELFRAVEESDDVDTPLYSHKNLVRLFQISNTSKSLRPGLNSREQKQILMTTIKGFSKSHARRFFSAVKNILHKINDEQRFLPESAKIDPEDVIPDHTSTEILSFIKVVAEVTKTYVDQLADQQSNEKSQLTIPTEVFDVAQALHDMLLYLLQAGPDAISAQHAIIALCEAWWIHNGVMREYLVVQAIPLLTLSALQHKSDIKRLYQIRQVFEIIDFDDPSSDAVRSHLLRIASSPLLLKTSEGKRLVAYLFHIDNILAKDIHQAIRVQIPEVKGSILSDYGDIYFRAWKEAPTDEIREALENDVISELTYAGIHVAHPSLAQSVVTLLQPFHDAKKSPDVEALLYRMYGPVLWRSMSAANAQVRVQATRVLAEVFPLQDPSHTKTEQAITKAVAMLQGSLQDQDPQVRVAGSETTAKILALFWDIIPPGKIRSLLNHIVAEHASDASSSPVRAAALGTVTALLDAPRTHAVLRPLLPPMGNLIHDKVEKVRLATVRLLLQVKKTKGIKYYHVVPVDHLTARLVAEGRRNPSNAVASSLTELMLNSYFPNGPNVTGVDQIKRTLTFLTKDPGAASVFYTNIADHIPVSGVAKLAAMLLQCLHAAVQTEIKSSEKVVRGNKRRRFRKKASVNEDESEDEQEDDSSSSLSAADTALMANLAETICTLWQSIESDLDDNEECNKFLENAFSGWTLTDALTHFEQKALRFESNLTEENMSARDDCYRTCAAILRSAGRLPAKAVKGLVPHISSMLSSLSTDSPGAQRQNVSAHIALLCLWNKTDQVAPALATSIVSNFDLSGFGDSPMVDCRRRKSEARSAKPGSPVAVPSLPPHVALSVLEDILRGSDPSSIAARESILGSGPACTAIEKALMQGTHFAERILSGDLDFTQSQHEENLAFVLRVCEAYGRFALHKQASSARDLRFNSQSLHLLDWTTTKVVSSLVMGGKSSADAPFGADCDISHTSMEDSSVPLSPVIRRGPTRRANRSMTPGKNVAETRDKTNDNQLSLVGKAFALSLLQSSCVIFAEWMAVGGAGAPSIAQACTEWCQVFEFSLDSTDMHDLLPAFSRLGAQLCRATGSMDLLSSLMSNLHVDDTSTVTGFKRVLMPLLVGKSATGEPLLAEIVEVVKSSAYRASSSSSNYELPDVMSKCVPEERTLLAAALEVLSQSKLVGMHLAESLVDDLSNASLSSNEQTFAVKCLWVLSHEDCKSSADVRKLVRRMDAKTLDSENGVRDLMEEIQGLI